MVFAFDTLGYSKRLRAAGVPEDQADAQAEAARDFIMAELVTKEDLRVALDTMTLRLTVRLGLMLAGAVAILATLQKIL